MEDIYSFILKMIRISVIVTSHILTLHRFNIKELIGDSQEKFTKEWQNSLSVASQDYNKRLRLLWDTIFDGLFRYVYIYTLARVYIYLATDDATII